MPDLWVGLHPVLITKMKAVLGQMAQAGFPMKPCQGLRTAEYQHSLYLRGRNGAPGRIVTNCDGFKVLSNHQAAQDGLGHAIDCCFDGVADPFSMKLPWTKYGAFVEAQSLVWGGRFRLKDMDHAELPRIV